MCKLKGESVDHVFVHCKVALFYGRCSLTRLGLRCVERKELGFGKEKEAKAFRGCSVLAVLWVISMERNRRMFEVCSGAEMEEEEI